VAPWNHNGGPIRCAELVDREHYVDRRQIPIEDTPSAKGTGAPVRNPRLHVLVASLPFAEAQADRLPPVATSNSKTFKTTLPEYLLNDKQLKRIAEHM